MTQDNKQETHQIRPVITDGSIYRLHSSTLWLVPFEALTKMIVPVFMTGLVWNFQTVFKIFTVIYILSVIKKFYFDISRCSISLLIMN